MTVNLQLDYATQSVLKRLGSFTDEIQCGKWNEKLIQDFQSDRDFETSLNALFEHGASERNTQICPDGLIYNSICIEFHTKISMRFILYSLHDENGMMYVPGSFTVITSNRPHIEHLAEFSCGFRLPIGDFYFPLSSNGRPLVIPPEYEDWAYSKRKQYNDGTLSSWVRYRLKDLG